ncbi:OmpW family outer membrane protein [Escherichia coli]
MTNNTQLGLTFTHTATDNIGVELLAATPFRDKIGPPGDRRYCDPCIICRQH